MKNTRKISGILAGLMCLSSVSYSSISAETGNPVYFYESFEEGNTHWTSRATASLNVDNQNAYSGNSSLFVSNRTYDWDGACAQIDASAFRPGETYSFSIAVMQKTEKPVNMQFTLQQGDTNSTYTKITSATVESGKWTVLENSEFTIPAGSDRMFLYVETTDGSKADFYIDSVQGAVKGTSVGKSDPQNPTESTSDVLRGDFNRDGKINVYDMTTARKVLVQSFSGGEMKADLSYMDLDGDGEFKISDVVMLSKYILGQIDKFSEPAVITTATTATQAETQPITTTVTTSGNIQSGSYMQRIAGDMKLKEDSSVSSKRAGVDYGTLVKKTYYSKDGGINKNVNILLPPGYNSSEKYPVLYVLHGIFGNEDSMVGTDMNIQTMLGNLIADGQAEKMIVVFPAMFTGSGSPGFTAESSRKYDLIREDIENSIMPFIEENYSVKTGRENTAITGFSMGGREALYTGITRSEIYGYVGGACPAPGIFPTTDDFMTHEGCMSENEFKCNGTSSYLILISAAQYDGTVKEYPKTYHEALAKNGEEHLWNVIPDGDHGGNTVRPHMYNFLRYIFKN